MPFIVVASFFEMLGWVPGYVWVLLALLAVPTAVWLFQQSTKARFGIIPRANLGRIDNTFFGYGVAAAIGQRPYMEDRHLVAGELSGHPTASLYAVFDGHAGPLAADHCVARMVPLLTAQDFARTPERALTTAFEQCDAEFLRMANAARPPIDDGTTAVAALVLWGHKLYVANAGDSRAVLVHKNGRASALSDDHKPNRQDEWTRIREAGGTVLFHGVWRVGGILAVSRAIGDRMLKPWVTARPEVRAWTLGSNDRFLVLASDGIFDVLGNKDVAEIVTACATAQAAADALVEQALYHGSADNVTALVVDLTQPNPVLAHHRTQIGAAGGPGAPAPAAGAAAGGVTASGAASTAGSATAAGAGVAATVAAGTGIAAAVTPVGSTAAAAGGSSGAGPRGASPVSRVASSGSAGSSQVKAGAAVGGKADHDGDSGAAGAGAPDGDSAPSGSANGGGDAKGDDGSKPLLARGREGAPPQASRSGLTRSSSGSGSGSGSGAAAAAGAAAGIGLGALKSALSPAVAASLGLKPAAGIVGGSSSRSGAGSAAAAPSYAASTVAGVASPHVKLVSPPQRDLPDGLPLLRPELTEGGGGGSDGDDDGGGDDGLGDRAAGGSDAVVDAVAAAVAEEASKR